jgi:hypothetical protein
MGGGANSKFLSRIVVVGLMALAFAGCAAMLAQGKSSLFADQSYNSGAAYAVASR